MKNLLTTRSLRSLEDAEDFTIVCESLIKAVLFLHREGRDTEMRIFLRE